MTSNKTVMTRPAELASYNVAHSDDALGCIMHSPAAHALLQPCALLHHPRDTKDLTLAGPLLLIESPLLFSSLAP